MTRALFLSDVHLQTGNALQQQLFSAFLDSRIAPGDQLYILGDLFDYWANNSFVFRSHAWVFEKLHRLRRSGCRIGLLIGNRDFLLQKKMVERFGIDYLGEETAVTVDEKNFFLAHGHTLCLADSRFLRYRARMWPVFRALDRLLPGCIENHLAARFQLQSKAVISAQDPARFQFTRSAIEEKFRAGSDYVICGHTHQPENFCQGTGCFHCLPAWDDSCGFFLQYADGELLLHKFELHE